MVLSQREKYVAIALSAVLVIVVLNYVVYSPLSSWSNDIEDAREKANQQKISDEKLFADQKKLNKVWDELKKGGLESDIADAQINLRQAVTDWAHQSNVNISAIKPQTAAAIEKSGFVQVPIQFDGTGTTSSVAKFLYQIEVAKIPVRIHNCQIGSTKDGVDDLHIVVDLTTLCVAQQQAPKPPADGPIISSAAKSDGQPQ